jgi:hypothetical protein
MMVPDPGRRVWPAWTVAVSAAVAGLLAVLLGTIGWFGVGFGVGSNCTDKFSCGSGSCAPCAVAHGWIIAGGVGQWVLVAVVVALLVLGLRRPRWRRAAALASVALLPLSVAWITATTVVAEHSF